MTDENEPIASEESGTPAATGEPDVVREPVSGTDVTPPSDEPKKAGKREKKKKDKKKEEPASEPAPEAEAEKPGPAPEKSAKGKRVDSMMSFFAFWMLAVIAVVAIIGIILSLIHTDILVTVKDVMNNIVLLISSVLFASAGYNWIVKRPLAWKIVYWVILVLVIGYLVVNTLMLCGVIDVNK